MSMFGLYALFCLTESVILIYN